MPTDRGPVPTASPGEASRASGDTALAANSLTLRGVSKRFQQFEAVSRVDLEVPRGEFLTLLGPSGSGKTTLLMTIAGFVEPTEGDIFVNERRITRLPPEKRNFGMVFQGYALFPHMSVAENVAYPLRVRGWAKRDIGPKVEAVLSLVRLDGFGGRYPRQLSGGQQQRVAIARALVFSPDILLFDEPLGALDRQLRAEVQIELKRLHARLGSTFVYVTHDQDEAMTMSDRVAIIDRGRLVQIGTPAELYERPATRFAAGFLGRSSVIDGRLVAAAGGEAEIAVAGGRIRHAGPVHAAPDGAVALMLRPEKVALGLAEPSGQINRARGRVESTAYFGATAEIAVATAAFGTVLATCFAAEAPVLPAAGAEVWVSWPPGATVSLRADEIP